MSRTNPAFGRMITALITPFNKKGEIDLDVYSRLIKRQYDAGASAVLSCGTTGESPTLTKQEKLDLFTCAKDTAKNFGDDKKVIANIGSNNTKVSVELAKEAENIGVHGLMAVVPYYNKPPQEGLYQHFSEIAKAVDIPIVLYNVPSRVSRSLAPETVIRLARDHENILYLKEAEKRIEADKVIVEKTSDDFEILSGNDDATLNVMEIGGTGVISTVGNVAPARMLEIVNLYGDGEINKAKEKEKELLPLMSGLFETTNPILVKEALNLIGIEVGGLRLPLISATKEESQRLKDVMNQVGEIK